MLIWSFDLKAERVRQYGVVKVEAESFGQSAAAAAARRRGKQQPGIRVLLCPLRGTSSPVIDQLVEISLHSRETQTSETNIQRREGAVLTWQKNESMCSIQAK